MIHNTMIIDGLKYLAERQERSKVKYSCNGCDLHDEDLCLDISVHCTPGAREDGETVIYKLIPKEETK